MKVNCPLLDKEIDDGICFDISLVAEKMAPEYTAPPEAVEIPDYKEKCLECKNHRD